MNKILISTCTILYYVRYAVITTDCSQVAELQRTRPLAGVSEAAGDGGGDEGSLVEVLGQPQHRGRGLPRPGPRPLTLLRGRAEEAVRLRRLETLQRLQRLEGLDRVERLQRLQRLMGMLEGLRRLQMLGPRRSEGEGTVLEDSRLKLPWLDWF